jgi:hypothetical protein
VAAVAVVGSAGGGDGGLRSGIGGVGVAEPARLPTTGRVKKTTIVTSKFHAVLENSILNPNPTRRRSGR